MPLAGLASLVLSLPIASCSPVVRSTPRAPFILASRLTAKTSGNLDSPRCHSVSSRKQISSSASSFPALPLSSPCPLLQVMVDSLANIGISSGDASRTFIKNEIMFCDIVAIQAHSPRATTSNHSNRNFQQDLSEPTKLMISHCSSSRFSAPPSQSQGYFFKSRMFPTKHSVTHRVYEFRFVFKAPPTFPARAASGRCNHHHEVSFMII